MVYSTYLVMKITNFLPFYQTFSRFAKQSISPQKSVGLLSNLGKVDDDD